MELRTYLLLPTLLVFSAACQDHATPAAPAPVGAVHDIGIGLDRSVVPAVKVLRFELTGLVDGRWVGSWFDPETGAEGDIVVAPVSFQQRGETIRLVQNWELYPPDPIIPPDPIRLELTGILNLASGRLALNLHPPDPIHPPDPVIPHRVHVRGTATTSEGGLASVIGELMFNPQPEPPGLF
jgi:hypothetical protein